MQSEPNAVHELRLVELFETTGGVPYMEAGNAIPFHELRVIIYAPDSFTQNVVVLNNLNWNFTVLGLQNVYLWTYDANITVNTISMSNAAINATYIHDTEVFDLHSSLIYARVKTNPISIKMDGSIVLIEKISTATSPSIDLRASTLDFVGIDKQRDGPMHTLIINSIEESRFDLHYLNASVTVLTPQTKDSVLWFESSVVYLQWANTLEGLLDLKALGVKRSVLYLNSHPNTSPRISGRFGYEFYDATIWISTALDLIALSDNPDTWTNYVQYTTFKTTEESSTLVFWTSGKMNSVGTVSADNIELVYKGGKLLYQSSSLSKVLIVGADDVDIYFVYCPNLYVQSTTIIKVDQFNGSARLSAPEIEISSSLLFLHNEIDAVNRLSVANLTIAVGNGFSFSVAGADVRFVELYCVNIEDLSRCERSVPINILQATHIAIGSTTFRDWYLSVGGLAPNYLQYVNCDFIDLQLEASMIMFTNIIPIYYFENCNFIKVRQASTYIQWKVLQLHYVTCRFASSDSIHPISYYTTISDCQFSSMNFYEPFLGMESYVGSIVTLEETTFTSITVHCEYLFELVTSYEETSSQLLPNITIRDVFFHDSDFYSIFKVGNYSTALNRLIAFENCGLLRNRIRKNIIFTESGSTSSIFFGGFSAVMDTTYAPLFNLFGDCYLVIGYLNITVEDNINAPLIYGEHRLNIGVFNSTFKSSKPTRYPVIFSNYIGLIMNGTTEIEYVNFPRFIMSDLLFIDFWYSTFSTSLSDFAVADECLMRVRTNANVLLPYIICSSININKTEGAVLPSINCKCDPDSPYGCHESCEQIELPRVTDVKLMPFIPPQIYRSPFQFQVELDRHIPADSLVLAALEDTILTLELKRTKTITHENVQLVYFSLVDGIDFKRGSTFSMDLSIPFSPFFKLTITLPFCQPSMYYERSADVCLRCPVGTHQMIPHFNGTECTMDENLAKPGISQSDVEMLTGGVYHHPSGTFVVEYPKNNTVLLLKCPREEFCVGGPVDSQFSGGLYEDIREYGSYAHHAELDPNGCRLFHQDVLCGLCTGVYYDSNNVKYTVMRHVLTGDCIPLPGIGYLLLFFLVHIAIIIGLFWFRANGSSFQFAKFFKIPNIVDSQIWSLRMMFVNSVGIFMPLIIFISSSLSRASLGTTSNKLAFLFSPFLTIMGLMNYNESLHSYFLNVKSLNFFTIFSFFQMLLIFFPYWGSVVKDLCKYPYLVVRRWLDRWIPHLTEDWKLSLSNYDVFQYCRNWATVISLVMVPSMLHNCVRMFYTGDTNSLIANDDRIADQVFTVIDPGHAVDYDKLFSQRIFPLSFVIVLLLGIIVYSFIMWRKYATEDFEGIKYESIGFFHLCALASFLIMLVADPNPYLDISLIVMYGAGIILYIRAFLPFTHDYLNNGISKLCLFFVVMDLFVHYICTAPIHWIQVILLFLLLSSVLFFSYTLSGRSKYEAQNAEQPEMQWKNNTMYGTSPSTASSYIPTDAFSMQSFTH
ncbi:hypothetical protein PCE1_001262 [Barthelona sp. PCE]